MSGIENILVQRICFLSVAFHLIGALFLYLVSIDLGWNLGGTKKRKETISVLS